MPVTTLRSHRSRSAPRSLRTAPFERSEPGRWLCEFGQVCDAALEAELGVSEAVGGHINCKETPTINLVRGSPGPHFSSSRKTKTCGPGDPRTKRRRGSSLGRCATAHNAGSPDLRGPTGATAPAHASTSSRPTRPSPSRPSRSTAAPTRSIPSDPIRTIRPNQAFGGRSPAEYLATLTAEETPASQTS